MLGPSDGAGDRRRDWLAAFELLIDVDLAGALAAIDAMLAGEDDYARMRAAAAAEVLVELRPEVAPVMGRQLVAALKLAEVSGPYASDTLAPKLESTAPRSNPAATMNRCAA
jgi:hypothetical protein